MKRSTLPARAGVGLKADHYNAIMEKRPDIGWFEVHAENYMGAGGPAHAWLTRIRCDYPLSVHGVGLSIGSSGPLDRDHLQRLKTVVERYEPEVVSEHLAWSSHGGRFFNDLLPLPYTAETLARVSAHIEQMQEALSRPMLLENPSTYVVFDTSTLSETDFLKEIVKRTGCGLLLDVNNVFVSATNHGWDAAAYLDAFPLQHVGEIHLGGHAPDEDDDGAALLIDAHDRAVDEAVWALYERAITKAGPLPTLIEWDNNIPDWTVLHDQALAAESILDRQRTGGRHAVAG